MSEELLIRCCAPTLASIKTGNMFTCRFETEQDMNSHLRRFNRRLREKGLRMVPLRYREGVGLIYVYRPQKLTCDLCNAQASELLSSCGYNCEHHACCVRQLRSKLNQQNDFPHEIGLFLGYPPEDVDGFMHRKQEAKCSGHWKVYGDVESAQRRFALYRKCTAAYLNQWKSGRPLERLTIRQ